MHTEKKKLLPVDMEPEAEPGSSFALLHPVLPGPRAVKLRSRDQVIGRVDLGTTRSTLIVIVVGVIVVVVVVERSLSDKS